MCPHDDVPPFNAVARVRKCFYQATVLIFGRDSYAAHRTFPLLLECPRRKATIERSRPTDRYFFSVRNQSTQSETRSSITRVVRTKTPQPNHCQTDRFAWRA